MTARNFAFLSGALVAGTGIMGMFPQTLKDRTESPEDLVNTEGYGKIGGLIPTNKAFNWTRIGIGATGMLASLNEKSAVVFNRTLAVAYAGMAIMGLIPKTRNTFGLMPIFGGNVALHAGTAMAELLTERNRADEY